MCALGLCASRVSVLVGTESKRMLVWRIAGTISITSHVCKLRSILREDGRKYPRSFPLGHTLFCTVSVFVKWEVWNFLTFAPRFFCCSSSQNSKRPHLYFHKVLSWTVCNIFSMVLAGAKTSETGGWKIIGNGIEKIFWEKHFLRKMDGNTFCEILSVVFLRTRTW